jgi:hypothetical protein
MRPVTIPWYGRVSEGRPCSAFDFQEKEEEKEQATRAIAPTRTTPILDSKRPAPRRLFISLG